MKNALGSALADEWWARDFGCLPHDLRPAHTHVQVHSGELLGNRNIWILVAGGCPLVSLPPTAMAVLSGPAATWSAALVGDASALSACLALHPSLDVEKVIGPASIAYGSSSTLALAEAHRARLLSNVEGAVDALRAACSVEEWDHGGCDDPRYPRFGVVEANGTLSAMASYELWNGTLAHLSVVTHPEYRARGLGSSVVACAAQHALSKGLLPQYRALRTNASSVRVGERLGFVPYGFSVSVRLRSA